MSQEILHIPFVASLHSLSVSESVSIIKFVVACSEDFGETFEKQGQIITVGEKPETPEWSGVGDMDVIWDWQEERWFMATAGPSGAVSYDKGADAESWKKWDGSNFTRSNWLEPMEAFKDTDGKYLPSGTRIGLSWNR